MVATHFPLCLILQTNLFYSSYSNDHVSENRNNGKVGKSIHKHLMIFLPMLAVFFHKHSS